MKPTIGNLRKVAAETYDPEDLEVFLDHVEFYIAGLKTATSGLGQSLSRIEPLLDNARRTREFINDRIGELRAQKGGVK